ncbi:MAG: regulatory protein RecX [Crocinitomicaceae bacterium]|nr:regulatory protein RecX [Crocinitomicaceae bacterium]MDG1776424.1 regulatory protein RecX [Crocinitomicaceae bacterium]
MPSECKYSFLEAKAKLESLCAYQERCSFELEQRMRQWGVDSENQSILLAHLISNNYLSEERFAEAFVSGKINIKRWGRIKIRKHLNQKFISEYSIKKGLSSIDSVVYAKNINDLAQKKYLMLEKEEDSYAKKAKIYRFLSSKGYENDLIRDCVDPLFNL